MTILADVQLATTPATIFEANGSPVFGSARFSIEKITFFNPNSITQTVLLFIKERNGIARKVRQFQLKENEGGEYLEPGETLSLENGDQLLAQTTTVNVVDCVVLGKRT